MDALSFMGTGISTNLTRRLLGVSFSPIPSDSQWRAHEELWKQEKEFHIFSEPEGMDAKASELHFLYELCLRGSSQESLLAYS